MYIVYLCPFVINCVITACEHVLVSEVTIVIPILPILVELCSGILSVFTKSLTQNLFRRRRMSTGGILNS